MQLTNPFYYLDNFRAVLDTLAERDGDLLNPDEAAFITEFSRQPRPPAALLVRMVMRKGPVFRARRLRYAEIGDTDGAAQPLIGIGWLNPRPALTVADLFPLYSKAQLVELLGLPAHRANLPRAMLLAGLLDRPPDPSLLGNWSEAVDPLWRLQIGQLCERLRLMFFGNFRQGWSEFVLADLGVFKYEKIRLGGDSRPFPTRRHVDDFHRLHECRKMLHRGDDPAAIEAAMPPHIRDCDWLEERRERLRCQIARVRARAEAQVRGRRPAPAAHHEPSRRLRSAAPFPAFELAVCRDAAAGPPGTRVEYRVRDHLQGAAEEETAVHYVENGLINSLFGLLCWPAVFLAIPGAFFHPFHHGPADLSTGRFVERRREEFARCLALLEGAEYRQAILGRYREKQGIRSPFVAWGSIDESLLRAALECVPAAHLAAWFAWMLGDLRANRCGFPDLIQFWPRSCRYRLIEVKAPGDRLQPNQRRCFDFLLSRRIPVSVCRVKWTAV